MSNSYFNFTTGRMVAGENALAEDVNAGFDAVAAGFDKLPSPDATKFLTGAHDTTSGSAGNFVLAVTADSYFDGMAVSFKANHSNSGACTLNVGSLGAKSLVDGNGSALAAGDIVANSTYAARYNSTSDKFHLVGVSSGNVADAAVVAANIADVATIADNIDELLLVDDNATAAAGSASDASGYAEDALTQAGLASDYADAAAASAANLPNATAAGADKILTTNATGDGWSYISKYALNGKNLLINGGFDVWQDGTSFTPSYFGSLTYTADNWVYSPCSTATVTVSRQALTPGSTGGLFTAKYFSRTVVAGTNIGTQYFRQRIEGLHQFSGRTVTLSFYAKSSPNLAGGKSVALNMLYDATILGPTMHYVYHSSSSEMGTTNSWQRYTRTFDVPAATHEALTEHSCLEVIFTLNTYNSTFTFDIANVQLEFGDIATDFEYRHPAEELALCQRYYEKGTLRGPFSQYNSAYVTAPYCQFLVEKRKVPSITLGTLSTIGNDGTPGELWGANGTTRGFNPFYNWTGGTVGRSFFGQVTWTANARL